MSTYNIIVCTGKHVVMEKKCFKKVHTCIQSYVHVHIYTCIYMKAHTCIAQYRAQKEKNYNNLMYGTMYLMYGTMYIGFRLHGLET